MPNFIPSGVTEEQLNKVVMAGRSAPPEPAEYEGPVYATEFINHRVDEVPVWEFGKVILSVPAKGKSILTSWSNGTTYAPFSKVVFEKDGQISTSRRYGFPDPLKDTPYVIELENVDGANSESLRIGDNFVEVLRGIPKRVAVKIDDAQVVFKKIVWKKRTVKIPIAGNKDYLETKTLIERKMVPRKKSEIQKIKKFLADQATDRARRDAERRFKGIEGAEETDDVAEMLGPDA